LYKFTKAKFILPFSGLWYVAVDHCKYIADSVGSMVTVISNTMYYLLLFCVICHPYKCSMQHWFTCWQEADVEDDEIEEEDDDKVTLKLLQDILIGFT